MKKLFGPLSIGFLIVSILVLYMVTFTVRFQEKALLLTFGKISRVIDKPGLHWRWPWQWEVVKFDGRIRTLDQQTRQTQTRDQQTIIATVYVNWRIVDPRVFYERFRKESTASEDVILEAQDRLRDWIADASNIISEYELGELVTLDEKRFKLAELEQGSADKPGGMLARLKQKVGSQGQGGHGIEIVDLGIRHLGVPDSVSQAVFSRMKADREKEVTRLWAEGTSVAKSIEGRAKSEAIIIQSKAQAQAKDIRGDGDAKAATHYAKFLDYPELASYFRKLDTLRKTLNKRTTIVLDGQSPPYEMLQQGPGLMENNKGPKSNE